MHVQAAAQEVNGDAHEGLNGMRGYKSGHQRLEMPLEGNV